MTKKGQRTHNGNSQCSQCQPVQARKRVHLGDLVRKVTGAILATRGRRRGGARSHQLKMGEVMVGSHFSRIFPASGLTAGLKGGKDRAQGESEPTPAPTATRRKPGLLMPRPEVVEHGVRGHSFSEAAS